MTISWILLLMTMLGWHSVAQEIRIRLFNGHNGRPINDSLNVDFYERDERNIAIDMKHNFRHLVCDTGQDGVIKLNLELTDH
jgi:hypothetical protein